jgi:hypothetical protein
LGPTFSIDRLEQEDNKAVPHGISTLLAAIEVDSWNVVGYSREKKNDNDLLVDLVKYRKYNTQCVSGYRSRSSLQFAGYLQTSLSYFQASFKAKLGQVKEGSKSDVIPFTLKDAQLTSQMIGDDSTIVPEPQTVRFVVSPSPANIAAQHVRAQGESLFRMASEPSIGKSLSKVWLEVEEACSIQKDDAMESLSNEIESLRSQVLLANAKLEWERDQHVIQINELKEKLSYVFLTAEINGEAKTKAPPHRPLQSHDRSDPKDNIGPRSIIGLGRVCVFEQGLFKESLGWLQYVLLVVKWIKM